MAAPTNAYLVAKHEDGFGDVFPLARGTTYGVGRAPNNRIALPEDELCSRDHAEVHYAEEEWYVRDLDSLNGTKLNKKPLRGDKVIERGDEVQFGRTKFVFLHDLADLPGVSITRDGGGSVQVVRQSNESRFLPADGKATAGGKAAWSMLFRLALDMSRAKNVNGLAAAVLDGLFQGVPAENGAVLAVRPNREADLLAHRTRDGKVRTFHKASQLVSSAVLDSGEAILAENVATHPQFASRDSIRDLKAGSVICVPVRHDSDVVGLIHLYTAGKQRFTEEHLDYAVAIAGHMATAWEHINAQDQLLNTNRELKSLLALDSELIGASPALKDVNGQIARASGSTATVLIRGESGSGKELVARALHFSSPRKNGPFVTLNCAAIAESLLESELFGHERGAFTGATEKMFGKFEAADKGTIFLDEIGEMPPSTQSKFLRVLEGHPFERLGGNNQIKVDVRVVAATNRPLEKAVREGKFRKDLFFRLQVIEIKVPPLRDRLGDVDILADHFLKRFSRETGGRVKGFTADALEKMRAYAWPGNVRELRNAVERAVVLNDGPYLSADQILLTTLDMAASGAYAAIPAYQPVSIEEMEKRHIRDTLKHTDWNKSRAAEILHIERSTLDRKIKAYGLSRES